MTSRECGRCAVPVPVKQAERMPHRCQSRRTTARSFPPRSRSVVRAREPAWLALRNRRQTIAGTGPAGGEGISTVARVTYVDMIRGFLTGQDARQFLFFTRTPGGIRAGKEFLARVKERSQNRDKKATVTVLLAQLKALRQWGSKAPADLSKIQQPVLVANGDSDRMVPSKNSHDLARRLPHSDLIIYPDAGHGGVFQFHADFVPKALEFLAR